MATRNVTRVNGSLISSILFGYGKDNYLFLRTGAQHQGDGVYTFTLTKPCGWSGVWDVVIASRTKIDDPIVIEESLDINIEYTPFMQGDCGY